MIIQIIQKLPNYSTETLLQTYSTLHDLRNLSYYKLIEFKELKIAIAHELGKRLLDGDPVERKSYDYNHFNIIYPLNSLRNRLGIRNRPFDRT